MRDKPQVSVVMPVFNAETFGGAEISSILAQTFRDFKLVVVIDGLTDGTGQVLSHWKGWIRETR